MKIMQGKDALIVVDVQNDFCPGGALGVRNGDEIIPLLNRYIERFNAARLPVIATRDWHPPVTTHFKDFGGVWPVHCVQRTQGAAFHPDLKLPPQAILVSKGTAADEDSYSAFHGKDEAGTPLSQLLQELGVERIFVGGLATDYCVKYTALDGIKQGLAVVVLGDAVRGVNLQPDDSEKAFVVVRDAGAVTLAGIDELGV
jgi:nicotinamidase/pyrazinamidase